MKSKYYKDKFWETADDKTINEMAEEQKEMKAKYYRTKDFGLASVLFYLYDLEKIEVIKDKKKPVAIFCFPLSDELEDTIKLFWNKQLRIEPLQYMETQTTLKKRMFQEINPV